MQIYPNFFFAANGLNIQDHAVFHQILFYFEAATHQGFSSAFGLPL